MREGGKERDALGVVGSADQLGLLAERKLRDTLVPALDDTADTAQPGKIDCQHDASLDSEKREQASDRKGKSGTDPIWVTNGWPRSRDESNLEPFDWRVPT